MTVGELREALRAMPDEIPIVARIRKNESHDGRLEELYEFREAPIDGVLRAYDTAVIQLDE